MSEGPRIEAIGYGFGRSLPGLFATNLFGPPYVDLIGRDRLMSAPAEQVKAVGDGIVLTVVADPRKWDTDAARAANEAVLERLGREFFFAKNIRDRQTKAPDWPA